MTALVHAIVKCVVELFAWSFVWLMNSGTTKKQQICVALCRRLVCVCHIAVIQCVLVSKTAQSRSFTCCFVPTTNTFVFMTSWNRWAVNNIQCASYFERNYAWLQHAVRTTTQKIKNRDTRMKMEFDELMKQSFVGCLFAAINTMKFLLILFSASRTQHSWKY